MTARTVSKRRAAPPTNTRVRNSDATLLSCLNEMEETTVNPTMAMATTTALERMVHWTTVSEVRAKIDCMFEPSYRLTSGPKECGGLLGLGTLTDEYKKT